MASAVTYSEAYLQRVNAGEFGEDVRTNLIGTIQQKLPMSDPSWQWHTTFGHVPTPQEVQIRSQSTATYSDAYLQHVNAGEYGADLRTSLLGLIKERLSALDPSWVSTNTEVEYSIAYLQRVNSGEFGPDVRASLLNIIQQRVPATDPSWGTVSASYSNFYLQQVNAGEFGEDLRNNLLSVIQQQIPASDPSWKWHSSFGHIPTAAEAQKQNDADTEYSISYLEEVNSGQLGNDLRERLINIIKSKLPSNDPSWMWHDHWGHVPSQQEIDQWNQDVLDKLYYSKPDQSTMNLMPLLLGGAAVLLVLGNK